jgi:hypothetical protein
MQENIEQVIGKIYHSWRERLIRPQENCPEDETLACFLEGRLPEKESRQLKKHLIGCDKCLELIVLISQEVPEMPLPQELIERAKDLVMRQEKAQSGFMEIILGLREKTVDLVKASGDILFGQEVAPLSVLRGRNVKDFGQEVVIVKHLGEIKVEAGLENRANYTARVTVKLSEIKTSKPVEGLRITLIRAGQDIESYIAEAGKAVFDNVSVGSYVIEISTPESIIGKIMLEIKKL